MASHSFNRLDSLFLEPERTAITEMDDVDFSGVRRFSVKRRLIFSKAELESDLALIAAARVEFNLHETSYGQLAAFIRSLLPLVVDGYFIRLTVKRFDELCSEQKLPDALRKALVVETADYVDNTSTYAPFTRAGGDPVTSDHTAQSICEPLEECLSEPRSSIPDPLRSHLREVGQSSAAGPRLPRHGD